MCLSELRGHTSVDASLLRARALLREGRPADAASELSTTVPALGEHQHSAEHRILMAAALARTGRHEQAAAALLEADVYTTFIQDPEHVTEVGYYKALAAFTKGEFDRAQVIAKRALDPRAGSANARLLEMLGLIAGMHGQPAEQIDYLKSALDHAARIPERDAFLEAKILNNIAIPASETNAPGLRDLIATHAAQLQWNDELEPIQFQVVHHLAWLDALAGDHLSAFRRFRTAGSLAPTAGWKSFALCGRAYLAREMNESLTAAECIADAEELIAAFDWTTSSSDERDAFLLLATLLAPTDSERADRYLQRYKSLQSSVDPIYVAAHGDPLLLAREAHATGLVAKAHYQTYAAVANLRQAHRLFTNAGSLWRAAVAALDIYDLTEDHAMLAFAREHAMRVPQSWLARRLRHTESSLRHEDARS